MLGFSTAKDNAGADAKALITAAEGVTVSDKDPGKQERRQHWFFQLVMAGSITPMLQNFTSMVLSSTGPVTVIR